MGGRQSTNQRCHLHQHDLRRSGRPLCRGIRMAAGHTHHCSAEPMGGRARGSRAGRAGLIRTQSARRLPSGATHDQRRRATTACAQRCRPAGGCERRCGAARGGETLPSACGRQLSAQSRIRDPLQTASSEESRLLQTIELAAHLGGGMRSRHQTDTTLEMTFDDGSFSAGRVDRRPRRDR